MTKEEFVGKKARKIIKNYNFYNWKYQYKLILYENDGFYCYRIRPLIFAIGIILNILLLPYYIFVYGILECIDNVKDISNKWVKCSFKRDEKFNNYLKALNKKGTLGE